MPTLEPITAAELAQGPNAQQLLGQADAGSRGLSTDQARQRLQQYGPNALAGRRVNPLAQFLGYFWGPIPWMIEVAAILSAVVRDWVDFGIILSLLVFNALIGFWQEHKAANALDALKKQLALKARALRDGKWQEIDACQLVPGDVIRIRLGDIVPADVKLLEGDYISIDQAALTGESLPVSKKVGETAYSGSVAKQGEMVALVTATGADSYFGRTAKLVEQAGAESHFQKAVMRIGDFLIFLAVTLSAVLILVQLYRGAPFLRLVAFVLILVLSISTVLGLIAVAETFGLLYAGQRLMGTAWGGVAITQDHLRTMLFLQLVAGGHLMLFVTRTRGSCLARPFPSWQLFSAIVGTQVFAAFLCAYGFGLMTPLPWSLIGAIWLYNFVWMFIQDAVKLGVYRLADNRARHHRRFLGMLNQPLHARAET